MYSPRLSSMDFASAWCAIVNLFAVGTMELLDYWYIADCGIAGLRGSWGLTGGACFGACRVTNVGQ